MDTMNKSYPNWAECVAAGCFLVGLCQSVGQLNSVGYHNVLWSHNFKTDNAVGATANAAEWIAEHATPASIRPADWLLGGVLLLIVGRLSRLTASHVAQPQTQESSTPPSVQKIALQDLINNPEWPVESDRIPPIIRPPSPPPPRSR